MGTQRLHHQLAGEQLQQQGLDMLYESSRILHRTPGQEAAVMSLLEHVRQMFRAERAEITLIPAGPGEPSLRTSVSRGRTGPRPSRPAALR